MILENSPQDNFVAAVNATDLDSGDAIDYTIEEGKGCMGAVTCQSCNNHRYIHKRIVVVLALTHVRTYVVVVCSHTYHTYLCCGHIFVTAVHSHTLVP